MFLHLVIAAAFLAPGTTGAARLAPGAAIVCSVGARAIDAAASARGFRPAKAGQGRHATVARSAAISLDQTLTTQLRQ